MLNDISCFNRKNLNLRFKDLLKEYQYDSTVIKKVTAVAPTLPFISVGAINLPQFKGSLLSFIEKYPAAPGR